jgi:hypothetical protein
MSRWTGGTHDESTNTHDPGAIVDDIVGARLEWNAIKTEEFDFLAYRCAMTLTLLDVNGRFAIACLIEEK